MTKSVTKLKARDLRRKGLSIINIAKQLSIAKSSISLWCRDIELTEEQKVKLLTSEKEGLRRGQLHGAEIQKKRRLAIIEAHRILGVEKLKTVSSREHLIAGLALYLGEGSKGQGRVTFVNSDALIIKFMMQWFVLHFNVEISDFTFYLHVHEMHKPREDEIIRYWVNCLQIQRSQFRRTFFVQTKQQKVYENYNEYFGTLSMKILKSTDLLYRIHGLMAGLLQTTITDASVA